jgi:hypothetical protein
MGKSDKNIVRDILRAQGIWDEPTADAIKVYRDAAHDKYVEGSNDANYDAQMSENFNS